MNTIRLIFAFVLLAGIGLMAFIMPRAIIEISLADFIIVTCLLGGGAAWMSGRAIALTWRPFIYVLLSMVLFAGFIRWVHYALFDGTLLSWHYYCVDLAVVLAIATCGYCACRSRQMITQYAWLYKKHGFLDVKPVSQTVGATTVGHS
jgi:hypothetical protein